MLTYAKKLYAELGKMLEETPDAFICAGKNERGTLTYRDDRQICNLFRRDGDTIVLELNDFSSNGELKFFANKIGGRYED